MRNLVIILIVFIAAVTFFRVYDSGAQQNTQDIQDTLNTAEKAEISVDVDELH